MTHICSSMTTTGILAKLSQLETRHQSIQKKQDVIDELALDTLFKMEVLLSKMKAYKGQHQQLQDENKEGESESLDHLR